MIVHDAVSHRSRGKSSRTRGDTLPGATFELSPYERFVRKNHEKRNPVAALAFCVRFLRRTRENWLVLLQLRRFLHSIPHTARAVQDVAPLFIHEGGEHSSRQRPRISSEIRGVAIHARAA
jgi:hypothetical protein